MFKNFENKIEGEIANDCQIIRAAFDPEFARLSVDARMLRIDSSSLSEVGRREFENFAADYAEELAYLDVTDTAAIEELSERMNEDFYNENVSFYSQSLESSILWDYQLVDDTIEELDVVVDIQQDDLITPENVLGYKEKYVLFA